MQAAFLLYEGFTPLDVIGPFQVLAAVPDIEPVFVAERPGTVDSDSAPCAIVAQRTLEEVPSPDIVVVPGSLASFYTLFGHEPTLAWIRSTHEHARFVTSVCTGSLLLAAAGLLEGMPATTHWAARDLLPRFGAIPTPERVVKSGKIITAGGVSAGIDMALHLVAELNGIQTAQAVQLGIEYAPDPPFNSGSKENASADLIAAVATAFAHRGATWISDLQTTA
ncbi:DJ-1/PfpI family protein [Nocardia anaemiae]|uniref:DJ-1/PfpI family protein n=1 Tax=Nocardia anaemiae TaxID=263910 RepID=UPI0007A4D288|nr:DJ-1/PfpI family protein [Nocardia anaemiae]